MQIENKTKNIPTLQPSLLILKASGKKDGKLVRAREVLANTNNDRLTSS